MQKHPDADSFMREYLARPTDATTRLVFADWLEETGAPYNAAWAYYIRLRDDADHHSADSGERRELLRQADDYAPRIRAKLTMSATRFVGYPKSLLQLLPAANITVRLANFAVHPGVLEFMPESVARENLVIPLDLQLGKLKRTLLIAAADPHSYDTAQKLEFILNCDVVFVGVEQDEVLDAINREYGQTETESVDSVLVDFADTAGPWTYPPTTDYIGVDEADVPIVRLVNLIFREAINLRADRILMHPPLGARFVRYRIDSEWVEPDQPPPRLLRRIVTRIAEMSGFEADHVFSEPHPAEMLNGQIPLVWQNTRYWLYVTIIPSPGGPTTQIDIVRASVV